MDHLFLYRNKEEKENPVFVKKSDFSVVVKNN
jgi:hypothetical protein